MNNLDLLDVEIESEIHYDYRYASFGERLVASLIDGLIVAVPNAIITYALPDGIGDAVSLVGVWFYSAMMMSSPSQATFGKQAMNIIVTDMNGERIDFGKASVRYFSTLLSFILLLIGYLMQPFTEKRQTLHDMIAGTLVYKK